MRNKKILYLFVMLTLSLFVFTECKQETDKSSSDLTALLLVLRARNSGTVGTRAQLRQASAARTAGTSAAGAARSAGRTAFNINTKDGVSKKELMAYLQFKTGGKSIPDASHSTSLASTRMTAVTCKTDTGATCTNTSSSIVLTGTDTTTCKNNASGGLITMKSLATNITGADQDSLLVEMTDGTVEFTNCGLDVTDFLNYPATTRVTMATGSTVTPRGTYKFTDDYVTKTDTYTAITVEDITVNGSVKFGTDTITLSDLRTVTSITEKSKLADIVYINASGTKVTANATYSNVFGYQGITTANGALTTSGSVNGSAVNAPLAFSDRKITWKVLCTKAWSLMTDADWESDSICTYTIE